MKNTKKLILNTLLLTAASFLMQTVGVSFNVYLSNRIGPAGIGLFQLTMTVYGMAATFACAGVRLGATRLNIDQLAKDPESAARGTMRLCLAYALSLSLTVAAVLFFSAPRVAAGWLGDPRTAAALRWLALGLPLVSLTAAMQGYFTAVRTVFKSAAAQGLEQAVKIAAAVFFLGRMLPRGVEYACLAIVFGMCAGEVASFLFSSLLLCASKPMRRRENAPSRLGALLHIAGPDAAGTCARSILLTTEHLLIPRGFQASGRSSEEAVRIYGIIHGMTLPVLLYPSAVLSSLASLLVPELSQLRVQGQTQRIEAAVRRILRLSLFYGIFVGGMFYAFAAPLSMRVYGNTDAVRYLQLLAPLVPVMYMDMSVDGMLKGLDQQKYSMRYNVIDSGMCVVLVWLLLPRMAIKGYILVLFLSEIYNFSFSLRRLLHVTNALRPTLSAVAKPLLCVACAALIPLGIAKSADPLLLAQSTPWLAAALTGGGLFYFTALYLIGSIQAKDLRALRQ
ncbi:MAG: oligosaccharide flippase family protein, partial [Oscillospiraceae bacterium]|nr:oligosaccharide flippase family protein [Oscillospiraceae bacterium]